MIKNRYGLQMKENTNLLDYLNVLNMLITQLVGFDVKVDNEDKAMLMLASCDSADVREEEFETGRDDQCSLSHEKMKKDDESSAKRLVVAKSEPRRDRSKSRGRAPNRKKITVEVTCKEIC